MRADTLYATTLTSGGLTVDPETGEIPTRGYAVARLGGTVVSYDDPEGFELAARSVARDNPGAYLGTWVHEGSVFIDAVDVVDDLAYALQLAADRAQLALYDLTHAIEISIAG